MPKYNNPRKTWKYPESFKAQAVELSHIKDIQVKQVAETLDIHPLMLSRWRKEYREGLIVPTKNKKTKSPGKQAKELSELQKLKKENERLHKELDILKKWQRFIAEEHQTNIDSSRNSEEN